MKYKIHNDAKLILDFWFSNKDKWFLKDKIFDLEVKKQFENLYEKAKNGDYDNWTEFPEETLALIILLDQFPRNMYRDTYLAYETDQEAIALSKYALECKYDYKLQNKDYLLFLYMPFQHSEDITDQIIAVEKFANVSKEAYEYARSHKEIIEKFGRFPHRNLILNRVSTAQEEEFLLNNIINF